MQTPFDTLFEQAQPDTAKIFAAPFLLSDRISKRALLLLLRFQKIIICESAGIFGSRKPQESRLFCFEKGRWVSAPDSRPFSCFREDGFFRFLIQLFRAWKRVPEETEVKSEESKPSKSQVKQNQTGIPFSYWPSRFRRKACIHGNSLVWRVSVPKPWFFVPRRGRRVYAYTSNEIIW